MFGIRMKYAKSIFIHFFEPKTLEFIDLFFFFLSVSQSHSHNLWQKIGLRDQDTMVIIGKLCNGDLRARTAHAFKKILLRRNGGKKMVQTKEWNLNFYCHGFQVFPRAHPQNKCENGIAFASTEKLKQICTSLTNTKPSNNKKIIVIFSFIIKFTFDIINFIWSVLFLPSILLCVLLSELRKKKWEIIWVKIPEKKNVNLKAHLIFSGTCFLFFSLRFYGCWFACRPRLSRNKLTNLCALVSIPRGQTKAFARKNVRLHKCTA